MVLVYEEETPANERDLDWWKRTIIYHVYVPSYYDSNGDGIGDLKGRNDFCIRLIFVNRYCLINDNVSTVSSVFVPHYILNNAFFISRSCFTVLMR